jgi:hypothetical protein
MRGESFDLALVRSAIASRSTTSCSSTGLSAARKVSGAAAQAPYWIGAWLVRRGGRAARDRPNDRLVLKSSSAAGSEMMARRSWVGTI